MLSVAEKIWTLSSREIRLLARSRSRLLCTLAVPLAGGIVCGWMTRTTSLPPVYCLAVFLALGAVLLGGDPGARASRALSAITGPIVFAAGWIIATLAVLVMQAAVLTACASIIGGFQVSTGILMGTVAVSLVVSVVAHRVVSA